jgi:hypothetical protein
VPQVRELFGVTAPSPEVGALELSRSNSLTGDSLTISKPTGHWICQPVGARGWKIQSMRDRLAWWSGTIIGEILLFATQSAAVLAVVVLVAGSVYRDHPWTAVGWLTLGLVFAWLLLVMPSRLVVGSWAESLEETFSRFREGNSLSDALAASYGRLRNARAELYLIGCLITLTAAGYLLSYLPSREVFYSLQQQRFGPAETAQVITALGGLGLAFGTGIASIIKAYALLLRARADVIRAKANLAPDEQPTVVVERGNSRLTPAVQALPGEAGSHNKAAPMPSPRPSLIRLVAARGWPARRKRSR